MMITMDYHLFIIDLYGFIRLTKYRKKLVLCTYMFQKEENSSLPVQVYLNYSYVAVRFRVTNSNILKYIFMFVFLYLTMNTCVWVMLIVITFFWNPNPNPNPNPNSIRCFKRWIAKETLIFVFSPLFSALPDTLPQTCAASTKRKTATQVTDSLSCSPMKKQHVVGDDSTDDEK